MKKSTKGAVAAAAAGIVLMGGLGTQASWQADGVVTGTAISSGKLKLVGATCDGWLLGDLLTGEAFAPSTDLLVPGSILTRKCTFTVDVAGVGISAQLGVEVADFGTTPNKLAEELDVSAVYKKGLTTLSPGDVLSDADVIEAVITVELPTVDATNLSQDLTATLDDITVTVSQA